MKKKTDLDRGKRVMLWSIALDGITLLIPKKKGEGYLKTPIFHSNNELGNFIDKELKYRGQNVEAICGLDGYVTVGCIEYAYRGIWSVDKEIAEAQVCKPIADNFGWDCKFMEHSEFMDLVISLFCK